MPGRLLGRVTVGVFPVLPVPGVGRPPFPPGRVCASALTANISNRVSAELRRGDRQFCMMPPGRAFETAIQFACYATIIVGCLLAWRFSSTRVFCLLLVLALALQPISGLSSFAAARVTMALVAVLLPVNFVVFSFLPERGFTLASIPIRLGILVADFVAVGVTGRPYGPAATNVGWSVLSPVNILFAIAFAIFALRLVHYRRPVESGFLWTLLAILLGLLSGNRITATA